MPSWKQHLLQSERLTKTEKEIIDKLRGLRIGPNPPRRMDLSVCGQGSSQKGERSLDYHGHTAWDLPVLDPFESRTPLLPRAACIATEV